MLRAGLGPALARGQASVWFRVRRARPCVGARVAAARGGAWEPPEPVRGRLEAAALRCGDGPGRRSPRHCPGPWSGGHRGRRGRSAFLTGEIGSNGTRFRAWLQIRSRGLRPPLLLRGPEGEGGIAPGKAPAGRLPSPSKAEIAQTKRVQSWG